VNDLSATLRSKANELSQLEFVSGTPGLYLMLTPPATDENDFAFTTRTASYARLMDAARVAQRRIIVALEKTERSPYSTQISVGRTRNCDVVLREPSVSKLHAHFFRLDGDHGSEWQLVDRGSANGTSVNGRRLATDPVAVKAGDRVLFGAVDCLIADGRVLYAELGPA